ncbi:MAG: hypothetical protein IKZ92_07310 [Muribaculaceae bacterium]|nr:hypothetical protein [Muribaculaceae bacterium]
MVEDQSDGHLLMLRNYVNSRFDNIITRTAESCPAMNDSDINFLCLYCCDLPTTVIMSCMGYNDEHSVYNKKRRIAKLLGLEVSLNEYINDFKPTDSETPTATESN